MKNFKEGKDKDLGISNLVALFHHCTASKLFPVVYTDEDEREDVAHVHFPIKRRLLSTVEETTKVDKIPQVHDHLLEANRLHSVLKLHLLEPIEDAIAIAEH